MSKQTEALKLALEALENYAPKVCGATITAIREALAEQPAQQQEPVAIDRLYIEALIEGLYQNEDPVSIDAAEEFERLLKTPASPPASKPWVGLTDEDKKEVVTSAENALWADVDLKWRDALMEFTEAKLREKNA